MGGGRTLETERRTIDNHDHDRNDDPPRLFSDPLTSTLAGPGSHAERPRKGEEGSHVLAGRRPKLSHDPHPIYSTTMPLWNHADTPVLSSQQHVILLGVGLDARAYRMFGLPRTLHFGRWTL